MVTKMAEYFRLSVPQKIIASHKPLSLWGVWVAVGFLGSGLDRKPLGRKYFFFTKYTS